MMIDSANYASTDMWLGSTPQEDCLVLSGSVGLDHAEGYDTLTGKSEPPLHRIRYYYKIR